jgi:hypothetical protein
MLNYNINHTDVNIGDEIICVDNSGSEKLIIDKKYTILGIEPKLNWITTICEDGEQQQYTLSRFITISQHREKQLNKIGI